MYSEQVGGRHRHFLLAIKVLTVFACLIACIANSYVIFTQFIGKKTITSQNVENNDGLLLPSITICSLSGFKEEMIDYKDLELSNYLNKTLNLDEILYGYYDNDNKIDLNLTIMKADQALWKFTTTYSQFKGRCHTLTYQKLVTSREMISLSLVGEIEFWLYIHGEGEEFYLHYDYWPSVPKIHHVRRPEASTDFVIKKSTEISDGNCYPAKEYSYFDCLRAGLIKESKNVNIACTLPWVESMKGVLNYSEETTSTCKTPENYDIINELGFNYSSFAAAQSHSKCLAHCQTSVYDVGIQTYDLLSYVNIGGDISNATTETSSNVKDTNKPKEKTKKTKKSKISSTRSLNIYFATTDVKVYTTSYKIDLNTFISNVGGNLGLFVGFSVLGGLFFIYDFIASHVCKNM